LGGALVLVLTVVSYILARRRLKNRERADRTPHRVLLEDSKRKAVGTASTAQSSSRPAYPRRLPEPSLFRR
jgi:hypothetical protein